jgi:hypothetical protein
MCGTPSSLSHARPGCGGAALGAKCGVIPSQKRTHIPVGARSRATWRPRLGTADAIAVATKVAPTFARPQDMLATHRHSGKTPSPASPKFVRTSRGASGDAPSGFSCLLPLAGDERGDLEHVVGKILVDLDAREHHERRLVALDVHQFAGKAHALDRHFAPLADLAASFSF